MNDAISDLQVPVDHPVGGDGLVRNPSIAHPHQNAVRALTQDQLAAAVGN